MALITLSNEEIDLIKEYKKMPLENRIQIAILVSDLFKMLQSNNRPSPKMIATMLSSDTEFPEVARACYMASLAGIDWGWRELPVTS